MQYVNKMKNALVSFNTTAQKIRRDMDRNNRDFLPDAASDANVKLQANLNKAADSARDQIDAIHEDARKAVQKWAEPAGAEIDTADLKLLDGSFQLSAEDLHNLLVKHQNSGTMVNAIAKYAREHDLTPSYIPNVEDKLYVYKSFAESAHSVIGRIMGNIGLNDNDVVLSKWAERGNISQRAELVLYGIKVREEPALVSRSERANFNFNFKHLDGR